MRKLGTALGIVAAVTTLITATLAFGGEDAAAALRVFAVISGLAAIGALAMEQYNSRVVRVEIHPSEWHEIRTGDYAFVLASRAAAGRSRVNPFIIDDDGLEEPVSTDLRRDPTNGVWTVTVSDRFHIVVELTR